MGVNKMASVGCSPLSETDAANGTVLTKRQHSSSSNATSNASRNWLPLVQGVLPMVSEYTCSRTLREYTRYMYNDDPLRQPGPHTRSYTPKRWQKPHTRTHTLESDKGHTHTHSYTRGPAEPGGSAYGDGRRRVLTQWGRSRPASAACRPTTPSAMCTASV